MINRRLIQTLHDAGFINKQYVLWWQLGFENRRIMKEEEFEKGLKTETWDVRWFDSEENMAFIEEKTARIWKRDDVPILLRNVKIDGFKFQSFISVKPISHDRSWSLEFAEVLGVGVYYEPHIRGVVIEHNDRFLFWYPISRGIEPMYYHSLARKIPHEGMNCFINPIHPSKFYNNLIVNGWRRGRRSKTKATYFDCEKEDYEIVPYFEFNPNKKHIMVYPVPLSKSGLDFPVLFKSNPKKNEIEVLGVGSSAKSYVKYWNINEPKKQKAFETIESLLK